MPGRGPVLVRAGEGRSVWSLGGRFTVKLDGIASAGRFSIVEALALRTTEPPLHIHHREDEAWYILDGRMTFHVADQSLAATRGDFVIAPMGLPHTFTVDVEPSRVLVFAAPSGFEQFALELGESATSDLPPADLAVPEPAILAPVAERYGIEVVGPPWRIAHPAHSADRGSSGG
jgi:mannose-6-phosphate isomerase-like protein (cupin superfamily)